MGEIDLDAGALFQPPKMSHLRALIVGERPPQLAFETVQDQGKSRGHVVGPRGVQLDEGQKQSRAVHQHADLGMIPLADDQIAFPVSGNQPLETSAGRWSIRTISGIGGLRAPLLPRCGRRA